MFTYSYKQVPAERVAFVGIKPKQNETSKQNGALASVMSKLHPH
jgi:hypothetical protein